MLVPKVLAQTNYSEKEAYHQLELFNGDYIKVIKNYMGIPLEKKEPAIKSINQEIYKQLRQKLDISMKEYRDKKECPKCPGQDGTPVYVYASDNASETADEASRGTPVTPVTVTQEQKPVMKKSFTPPTIEESIAYGKTIGLPDDQCRHFHDHHETRDWLLASGKMKNWKAAMRTWLHNYKSGVFSGRGKFAMKPVVTTEAKPYVFRDE
jgi:hypothetical protein